MVSRRLPMEELASPGGKTLAVARAPKEPLLSPSRRMTKVIVQEEELGGALVSLEEGTRQRKKAFEEKLSNIEERARSLQLRIDAEAGEREHAHRAVMEALDGRLKEVLEGLRQRVQEDIAERFEPGMAKQEERIKEAEADVEAFLRVKVPAVVEQQSGAVTRRLTKATETFDMESAKIARREQKISARFEAHAGRTAQAFEDERATRLSRLWLLGEDIDAAERMDDRSEEATQVDLLQQVAAVRESVEVEAAEREQQDCTLLDSMLAAQERLQRCIVETFGVASEEFEP